jgi:hypothetical protein
MSLPSANVSEMKTITLFIGVSMLASVSFAQISSTSQFSGTLSDNFESYPDYATSSSVITLGVMGGAYGFTTPAAHRGAWAPMALA